MTTGERRVTWCGPGLAIAGFATILGCSGGGGDGGGGGGGSTQVPAMVDYGFNSFVMPLVVEFSGGTITLEMTMAGTYVIDTEEYTIQQGPIGQIRTGALFGDVQVNAIDPVLAFVDEYPTTGTVEIVHISTGDVIRSEIDNMIPGVTLYYDQGGDGVDDASVSYDWDQLDELYGSGLATEWEELASFVYAVLDFAYERFFIVVEAFVFGFDYEEDLELAGPGTYFIVRTCDFYQAGVLQEGHIFMTWEDVDQNLELGPGDDFLIDIDDCWVDDPANTTDQWFDGLIQINGLIDVENPFTTGGALVFERFIERETEMDGLGGFVPGSESETNGEADVIFFE